MKHILIQVGITFLVCYICQIVGLLMFLFNDAGDFKNSKHFFWWCIPLIPFMVLIYKKIKDLD